MKKSLLCLTSVLFCVFCFAQENLCSIEDEYYQLLNLQGLIENPTLNYKTLSDSDWNTNEIDQTEYDVWKNNNLSKKYVFYAPQTPSQNFFLKGLNQSISQKIYSPDWYSSYNTAAPFGQNDGGLWQGRGFNTSFAAGIRFEAYGFELTARPQLNFSENKYFTIMPSALNPYGYFWGHADAPQRFGDKSFWNIDWSDTEARFTWYTFTVGFGTQSVWLGPAKENPLLFSNNAPSFPKLDIGLRKTKVVIPGINWYAGDIEGRWFMGKLSESEYFDSNPENDFRRILVLNLSYAPSFFPGFTVGATKVTLTQWLDNDLKYLNPFYNDNAEEDQKAAFTFDWKLPSAQFELYSEFGIDDYTMDGKHGLYGYLRYPFHTMTSTVGFRKDFMLANDNDKHLLIDFEFNTTEMSQDFQMQWGYNFGFHSVIIQGYTNEGQWLGSGIGYGGNSQKLSFTYYRPYGYTKFIIGRNNPDNNYIFSKCIPNKSGAADYFSSYKANFYAGLSGCYFVTKDLIVCPGLTYDLLINPLYQKRNVDDPVDLKKFYYEHNFAISLELKYQF